MTDESKYCEPTQIGTIPKRICPGLIYDVPIYGRRRRYLWMRRAWFDQVMVRGFGSFIWVNVWSTP